MRLLGGSAEKGRYQGKETAGVLSMDWKIVALIIVAAVIIISGLLGSSDVFGNLQSIGKIFSGFASTNVSRDISVTGIISVNEVSTKIQPQYLEVSTNAPAVLFIGNEKIELNHSSVISINNFSGSAAILIKGIDIDGSAEAVYISDIGILPHEQSTITVRASSARFDSARFFGEADKLSFNASGSVGLNQFKIALKLDSEIIEIGKYRGQLNITGNSVMLEGFANAVSVSGNHSIVIK